MCGGVSNWPSSQKPPFPGFSGGFSKPFFPSTVGGFYWGPTSPHHRPQPAAAGALFPGPALDPLTQRWQAALGGQPGGGASQFLCLGRATCMVCPGSGFPHCLQKVDCCLQSRVLSLGWAGLLASNPHSDQPVLLLEHGSWDPTRWWGALLPALGALLLLRGCPARLGHCSLGEPHLLVGHPFGLVELSCSSLAAC